MTSIDGFVKGPVIVIPAKSGIQNRLKLQDSRLRGDDAEVPAKIFFDFINN